MNSTKQGSQRTRIAVVTNRVPVYRLPVFGALQARDDIELRVFVSLPVQASAPEAQCALDLCHSPGIDLSIRTRHRQRATHQVETMSVPLRLPIDLLRYRPELIIAGEFGPRSLLAYAAAAVRRIPLVLWSEEIAETATSIGTGQRWLRMFLLPRASAFLAWGAPAVDYLRTWNVSPGKIYACAQAVDNRWWAAAVGSHDGRTIQAQLGVTGKVFLAVGQLIPRKGFDLLLRAWAALPRELQSRNSVVIVGDGEQGRALRALAVELGIPNVLFAGFASMTQLPRFYAAADVLVFPSLVDVWGLVVNEALACGLPVLASRYAGASQELIAESGCGEVFDPNDQSQFTQVLRRWCLAETPVARAACQAAVAEVNFDKSVDAILGAVHDLTVRGARSAPEPSA